MLNRLKDILKAELHDKLENMPGFKDSFADLEVDEILKDLYKKYGTPGRKTEFNQEQEETYQSYQQHSYQAPKQPSKDEEYYKALELPNGAGWVEVKKAYRKLMKVYHPDLFHNDPEKLEMAQQVSSKLNEAYVYFEKKFGQ